MSESNLGVCRICGDPVLTGEVCYDHAKADPISGGAIDPRVRQAACPQDEHDSLHDHVVDTAESVNRRPWYPRATLIVREDVDDFRTVEAVRGEQTEDDQ